MPPTAVAPADALHLEPEELAQLAHLRYYTDDRPGYTRQKAGEKEFHYFDQHGQRVTDEADIQRINSLAIPPAYTDVWICPSKNGHLQATGKDAKGRKQYRYHPKWRETADANKYSRVMAFALALPDIRRRVDHDLSKPGLPREKVLATVVKLLETTLIRVGNEEYAKTNKHYGLTTMRNRHVKVKGATIEFSFRGKSGVDHTIELENPRMARVVKSCQEIPGQELFQYLDHDDQRHSIDSADVNAYLQEISGQPFTAKDFRTWAGTVLAAMALQEFESLRLGSGRQEEHRRRHRACFRAPGQHAERLPQVLCPSGDPGSLRGGFHARRVARQGREGTDQRPPGRPQARGSRRHGSPARAAEDGHEGRRQGQADQGDEVGYPAARAYFRVQRGR